MANRLAGSLSPYLRQHAENPVDWWEWGDDAFAEARRRDVPVLLSVGYAACHWCHVMAHESFEDEHVARVLADGYVAIKVDREERPDIDAVYMSATQALAGHGGWPMTCVLTPDGEPFFAGTYLPKANFLQLLSVVTDRWRTDRDELSASAGRIAAHLRQISSYAPTGTDLDEAALSAAVRDLRRSYDDARGGFGGAPKFPPSMVLEFLLRHHARTGDADALAMVEGTCEAMARGGLFDQLAGGFARYSVDANWVVPHFEKMLYDNALLLSAYAHLWRATGSPLAERVTRETADFLLTDLLTPQGGFAASLDADAAGVEGLTYAWSQEELTAVLGPRDGARAAALLRVTADGTFEHGRSTLQLHRDPDDFEWWARVRGGLLAARAERPQPARDDKVVMSWNGLAISALCDAGLLLDEPRYVDAARRAADHVLSLHVGDDGVRRVSLDGRCSDAPAMADDLGNFAAGLLQLHQATCEAGYLDAAGQLLERAGVMSDADGGWRDSARDDLIAAPRAQSDNAEPSGTSALATAWLTYGTLVGEEHAIERAARGVQSMSSVARQDPRFAGWALAAAEALAAGPLQVAIVGADADDLVQTARASTSPGQVTVVGEADFPGVPLLAGRVAREGRPTAYVCRGFVCDSPITDPEQLRTLLSRRQGPGA